MKRAPSLQWIGQDPEDDGTQVLRRGNLRSDAEWTRHVLGLLCVCWSDDDAWQMKERQKKCCRPFPFLCACFNCVNDVIAAVGTSSSTCWHGQREHT